MRSTSRVLAVIIAGTLGLAAGLTIGVIAAPHSSKGAPHEPPPAATVYFASTAKWAAEGAKLVNGVLTQGKGSVNTTYRNGNWAYESRPVDVTKDGSYTLDFGPVPTSFDYPAHPKGISYDWPPDATFSAFADGCRTVTQSGKKYFQVGITVSGLSSP
jgi:hypothetical protein